jgi:hypothetical protein
MKINTNTKLISKKSFDCYLFEEKERLQIQNLNKNLKEGEILGTNDKGFIIEFHGENSFFLENHEFKSSIISKQPYFKVKNFYNPKTIKIYEPWTVNKLQEEALIKQKTLNFLKIYILNNSLFNEFLILNNNSVDILLSKKKENNNNNLYSNYSIKKKWYLKHNSKKVKITFLKKKLK